MHRKTQCPSCRALFKVQEQHLGRDSACKRCGHCFVLLEVLEAADGELAQSGAHNQPGQGQQLSEPTPRASAPANRNAFALTGASESENDASATIQSSRMWSVIAGVRTFVRSLPLRRKWSKRTTRIAGIVVLAAAAITGAISLRGTLRRLLFAPANFASARASLADDFKVTGTLTAGSKSESFGLSTASYQEWKVAIELRNGSPFDVNIGDDLIVFEADGDGTQFEGVALFVNQPDGDKDELHLFASRHDGDSFGVSNYECRYTSGRYLRRTGSVFTFTAGPGGQVDAANLATRVESGAQHRIEVALRQGTCLKPEFGASVRVVLPEITAETRAGSARFRVIAYCEPRGADKAEWVVARQEVIELSSERLQQLLRAPETSLITRICAANWLVRIDPERASPALVDVAKTLRSGQLLAACLELLTASRATGLGPHASDLLKDRQLPNGIRSLAARYIAASGYADGLHALTSVLDDQDEVVWKASVAALGKLGGEPAAQALFARLADQKHAAQHQVVASAVAELASASMPAHAKRFVEAVLTTTDTQVASSLVDAVLKSDWKDRSMRKRLAEKLKGSYGDVQYHVMRLLRRLSGDAMGPADYSEWQKDRNGWAEKWQQWAAKP